jgi:hypothetical protein
MYGIKERSVGVLVHGISSGMQDGTEKAFIWVGHGLQVFCSK